MLRQLGSVARHRPRTVMAVWLLVGLLGLVAAGVLFSSLDADLDDPASFESEQVSRRLDAIAPGGESIVGIVEGAPVPDETLAALEATPGVASVVHGPSDDGVATGIAVELEPALDDGTEETAVEAVESIMRDIDAPEVLVGGELLVDEEFAELAEKDAKRAELLSLPIAIVVMIVVLGGLLAAGLPLALAFGGVFATMLALGVVASVMDVSVYALNVVIMLGIGLGIDYGLLMVSRFREERGAGRDVDAAVDETMSHSGRTVAFSAATVAVALSGLLVFEDATMRSIGIAGIIVVLACMTAALTLLPALLARFGHRLRPAAAASDHGAFARLSRFVTRRAGLVVVAVSFVLVLLAAPLLDARFDDLDVRALPKSSESRQVSETIDARFGGVTQEPIVVVTDAGIDAAALDAFVDDVTGLDGVRAAEVVASTADGVHVVEVSATGVSNGPDAQRLVGEIRDLGAPFTYRVGGDPAETVDFRHSVSSRLPLALGIVAVTTFVLLFLMTGSVLLPLKAIAMNVLSLAATFGALVWVFQDGHFSGVLNFAPTGALDLVMPVVIFVFAFGLSMDYEVFMLARIKEAYDETGDNDAAVAVGLQRSGKIITTAALLIVLVFAGFVAGEIVAMKQLGLGLALAVIIDATIVRLLLVPAAMKLMGRWNWWAPRPLARVHSRLGLREQPRELVAT
ncbi:MAG: MMPL family transporter [Acidimicrobiia bacterium]